MPQTGHPSLSEDGCILPLCVELEGALVRTDFLWEGTLVLLRRNPLYLLYLPLWLFRGKARLKREIASRITIDPAILPYHPGFQKILSAEHSNGRILILTSAADALHAESVASHLGFFKDVMASDGFVNFSGAAKMEALVGRYGLQGFSYAGSSRKDIPLWKRAGQAVLVDVPKSLTHRIRKEGVAVGSALAPSGSCFNAWIRALRLHQWVKNVLLFVPLILAHRITDPQSVGHALVAFFSFSLVASGAYLVNDLFDLDADRRHVHKRKRPIASGDLSLKAAAISVPFLLAAGFGLSLLLPEPFIQLLSVYVFCTLAYSLALKRLALMDVVVLAGLFMLRILSGAAAVEVPYSPWLLGFAVFFFLSLALAKRHSELFLLQKNGEQLANGRGYRADDFVQLGSLGSAAGYISIMVLALYINSQEVVALYSHPLRLWLVCPLLIYWISRVWLLSHRGEIQEDPVIFALKDRVSYLVGAGVAVIMLLAV